MSRESRLAKNTFVLAIGNFMPKIATFITLPILTGCLTKEEYGTYDLIVILVSLILPSATLQIQTAAFRFLIDVRDDEQEINKIVTNIFAFIIPTSVIALVILYFCLPGQSISIKLWICMYFLADILFQGMGQACRGLAKNFDYSISAIATAVGKVILTVVFVMILGEGLLGATMALSIATLLSIVFLFFKSKLYKRINIGYFSFGKIKELLKYSWPMVPSCLSMWVISASDRFVITMFMGVAANAVYSVANKIPSILTVAQSTFTMAWQESASIVSKEDDADTYYSEMFRTMFNLMAGFLGLLIVATPVLFVILVRGDYSEAYNQIPILFLGMFFFSMSSFLSGVYVAYKKTKSVGFTTLAAAACNLIINFALINWIGLYAASLSTLISFFLLFIFRMINARKFVKIKYNYKHIFIVFSIMLLESVLCFQQNFILNCINFVLGIVVFFVLNRSFVNIVWKKVVSIASKVTHKK